MKAADKWALTGILVNAVAFVFVGSRPLKSSPVIPDAFAFEIAEIVALVALTIYAFSKGQTVPGVVFSLALAEHIRQVVYCERTAARSPRNLLTLMNYCILLALAAHRGWWEIVAVMLIGIGIHVAMIVANRPFTGLVCVAYN